MTTGREWCLPRVTEPDVVLGTLTRVSVDFLEREATACVLNFNSSSAVLTSLGAAQQPPWWARSAMSQVTCHFFRLLDDSMTTALSTLNLFLFK